MSGLTLSDIRTALADVIRSGVDRQVNVYPYPVGDYPFPAITVDFDADYLDYFLSFGSAGIATVRFVLRLEPAGNDKDSAARALDDYLSAGTGNGSSVVDAVMSNTTLGLTGCAVMIRSVSVDPTTVTAEVGVEVTIAKQGASA